DGRAISGLTLSMIAASVSRQYRPEQVPRFLREAGITDEPVASADGASVGDVEGVLVALADGGAEARRVLRRFIARWLDDELAVAPCPTTPATVTGSPPTPSTRATGRS